MKKVSSNQTDAFKRKNALRYALGGEVTTPPVLGKTRAAQDAAIDAEAVKGTGLAAEQPAPVKPSITAPPPTPAPTLGQGNYEAAQLLRQQPNNSVMSRLRGTNTFQFGVGGAIPVEPAFREQGGPSKRRLGADSGIPGIPPAFAPGGSIGLDGLDDMLDDWQVSKGPQQLTGLSPVGAPQSMNGRLLAPGPALDPSITPDMARSYAIRSRFSSPTENQDSYEFLTKTGMYARPGSEPSVRNPDDPVDYTVAGERRANQNNALRAQQAAAEQAKGPFIGRFPGDSRFEEGGPITANHPPKQGKDNQVVLAAAGEYILPKATVDAMGGPDMLDNIVRATNGKEPNNSNGSMLRAEDGLRIPNNRALVPYNPVVGQAGGPPLGIPESGSFRPGQHGYSALNQAINTAGGTPGNRGRELAKHALRKAVTPEGIPARTVVGGAKLVGKALPYVAAASAAHEGLKGFSTPTADYERALGPDMTTALRRGAGFGMRNAPFVGPVVNALFPQTPDGNTAVGDLAVRGAGMLAGTFGVTPGQKTEIKTEKPQSWADGDRIDRGAPVQAAPSETSAPQAPATSRLRGVMDGVNMAALMTPRGFTGEFGKMLATRGENTAAMLNNRQQMAERQMDWERQKFGLQRDWDMRRYGIDKTTDMAAKNRELGYKMIEDRFRVKDDPKSEEQVALAKAQMDAGMLDPRVGGWHAASADTISEGVRLLGTDAKAANERTGLIMGPVRNALYGDYNRARTPWDLMPQGATVPGVISNSVPVGSGGLSPDEATGRPNRWLPGASPPSQVDIDRLRQTNKGYADGGRVVKSKLRKNAC